MVTFLTRASKAERDFAREYARRSLYAFTKNEMTAIFPFFTNADRRVFFMHSLPQAVGDTLLSMYSRIKNKRGLRGVFVDNFLPQFLATQLVETREKFNDNAAEFIKERNIHSLDEFMNYSQEAHRAFKDFLSALAVDREYIKKFAAAPKVHLFLKTFLDAYGHNSIARMAGGIWICFEQITILAAKSLEWGRPGAGYIELSTRYAADMAGQNFYEIWHVLKQYGIDEGLVRFILDESFRLYRKLQGENFSGPFPTFLREQYTTFYSDDPKGFEAAIIGETCDVLGNLLPAATFTSVGVCVSGEAFPELVKHLLLDKTPENDALVEMLLEEAVMLGNDQFARHLNISPWQEEHWKYMHFYRFPQYAGAKVHDERFMDVLVSPTVLKAQFPHPKFVENMVFETFRDQKDFSDCGRLQDVLARPQEIKASRTEYDKLPNQFEYVSGYFTGEMSFRGWRDLQRQGFCTHFRTYLTPRLGFYRYDKNAPKEFFDTCRDLHRQNYLLWQRMSEKGVSSELMQYPMALGNMVGFQIGGNLRQFEFCNWQRSKWGVNHEVRQIFLQFETILRNLYPWWEHLSRTDMTPGYLFARGKKAIPLTDVKEVK